MVPDEWYAEREPGFDQPPQDQAATCPPTASHAATGYGRGDRTKAVSARCSRRGGGGGVGGVGPRRGSRGRCCECGVATIGRQAVELLQRAAGRRRVDNRLRRAVDVPAVLEDGAGAGDAGIP